MSSPLTTPIVYACSGSSNTGQMANYLALCLHRARIAKMSCLAGVGGRVPGMLPRSKRPIVAIDGCERHCARRCLARCGVRPDRHYTITDFDIPLRPCLEFDETEAALLFEHIRIALTAGAPRDAVSPDFR